MRGRGRECKKSLRTPHGPRHGPAVATNCADLRRRGRAHGIAKTRSGLTWRGPGWRIERERTARSSDGGMCFFAARCTRRALIKHCVTATSSRRKSKVSVTVTLAAMAVTRSSAATAASMLGRRTHAAR